MEKTCLSLLPLSDPPPPLKTQVSFGNKQCHAETFEGMLLTGIYDGQENIAKHLSEYSLTKQSSNRMGLKKKAVRSTGLQECTHLSQKGIVAMRRAAVSLCRSVTKQNDDAIMKQTVGHSVPITEAQ